MNALKVKEALAIPGLSEKLREFLAGHPPQHTVLLVTQEDGTTRVAVSAIMSITLVQYSHPSGDTKTVEREIPSTPQREANYKLLQEGGYNIALEFMGNMVFITLDGRKVGTDGIIVENGPDLVPAICKLIDDFQPLPL